MTREEMIAMAKETRKQVTNAVVPPELLAQYPADIQLMKVPTRVGDADVYETTNARVQPGGPVIVNFHGGGFIRERTPNDEVFCRRILNALDIKIYDVDYKIAPDYPFPTALYESYDVVKWIVEHAEELQVDPGKIIIMGHSAGGNLCCGISMMALKSGDFMPYLAAMEYPPLDLATDPADKPFRGKGIPYERARLYNLYYADPDQLKEPLVSPFYAAEEDLKGFPTSLMVTAGQDDLCTEAEEFALKLARAGTEVTLRRYPDVGHGFTIYRRGDHDGGVKMFVDFIRKNL